MRALTLSTGLALTLAAMLSSAPAKAEMGGPIQDGSGMCRQYGPNNNNLDFSYMDKCPGHELRRGTGTSRVIKTTNHGVGSGIGRSHLQHRHTS